nr:AzlC family ABC transporter permease [Ferrimonas kyonanensis]
MRGALAMLPLTLAVIPWGFLAGSAAIEAGLSPLQSQAMSAVVFAGAAQIAAIGMIKAGVGLGSLLLTTALITSRHLLYAMAMRPAVAPLPIGWRASLGFLLTDELFAIAHPGKQARFDPWYALGGGLSFYLGWNLSTFGGIVLGRSVEQLDQLGLDFAIAATFIALVVPTVRNWPVLLCTVTSAALAVFSALMHWQTGLLIAALGGMAVGALSESWLSARQTNKEAVSS